MSNYILINKNTGLYLQNGDFIGRDKNKATHMEKDKAEKLKKAFNTLTQRLKIEIEKA